MKKIISLILGLALLLTFTSCYQKRPQQNNDSTLIEESHLTEENISTEENSYVEGVSCMSFVDASNFSDGVAWVKYADENQNYQIALIDTTGKILYNQEWKKNQDIPGEMSGLSIIKNNDKIILIDKSGNIITDSTESDFDAALAYGDGYALVYKYVGPKNAQHIYKVIDIEGNTINELKLDEKYTIADYINCGIFSIEVDYYYGKYCLFNVKNGKTIYINSQPKFYNNIAYIRSANLLECDDYGNYNETEHLSFCTLDTNFQIKNSNVEWTASSGGFIYTKFPASIIDFDSGKKYPLVGYENIAIQSIEFLNDYGCVKFIESDNYYFTLINSKADEQLEPIYYDDMVVLSKDKIAYKDENNTFVIIDYKGNVLAENLDYNKIGQFNDDIALAVKDDHYYYINSKGEQVFESIHK